MTISTVNAMTKEFIDELNENFALMESFISMAVDVPAFTSQFYGVDPTPPLTSSVVGALAEVISSDLMGTGNIGMGPGALGSMKNGAVNVAIGNNALGAAQHEAYSVAVGWGALALSEGYENTAVGYRVLKVNSSGIQNTGTGAVALYNNTTGSYNSGLGSHTLVANTTGYGNTAAGYEALSSNTTGLASCAFGVASLLSNNADGNCGFGYESLRLNVSGTRNNAFGRGALYYSTGSYNVAVGSFAGDAASLTADGLVLLGYQSGGALTGAANYNVMIGYLSGWEATTGAGNILIGPATLTGSQGQVTTGSRNVSIGYSVAVASPTANDQLSIGNLIYGTSLTGTGSTISTSGKIGIGTKAPATELEVVGTVTSTALATGAITSSKYIRRAAPNTQTGASYSVADTDTDIIADRAGTVTLTLPAAASYTGRELYVRTIQAQTVVSATSNVVPLIGGAAGTAILAATAGKWARLVSDGTNWQTMAAA